MNDSPIQRMWRSIKSRCPFPAFIAALINVRMQSQVRTNCQGFCYTVPSSLVKMFRRRIQWFCGPSANCARLNIAGWLVDRYKGRKLAADYVQPLKILSSLFLSLPSRKEKAQKEERQKSPLRGKRNSSRSMDEDFLFVMKTTWIQNTNC